MILDVNSIHQYVYNHLLLHVGNISLVSCALIFFAGETNKKSIEALVSYLQLQVCCGTITKKSSKQFGLASLVGGCWG